MVLPLQSDDGSPVGVNALKFTFDGHVTVSLGEKDGQAVLRVADTGSGIPQDELPRLFGRFYRARTRGRGPTRAIATGILAPVLSVTGLDAITTVVPGA